MLPELINDSNLAPSMMMKFTRQITTKVKKKELMTDALGSMPVHTNSFNMALE